MTRNFPSRKLDKFILRLPDGMRDAIAASAKANKRSMNAEIVVRLQSSFMFQRSVPAVSSNKATDEALTEGLITLEDYALDFADRIRKQFGTPIEQQSPKRKGKMAG